jgi:hypothetical protein
LMVLALDGDSTITTFMRNGPRARSAPTVAKAAAAQIRLREWARQGAENG